MLLICKQNNAQFSDDHTQPTKTKTETAKRLPREASVWLCLDIGSTGANIEYSKLERYVY